MKLTIRSRLYHLRICEIDDFLVRFLSRIACDLQDFTTVKKQAEIENTAPCQLSSGMERKDLMSPYSRVKCRQLLDLLTKQNVLLKIHITL